MEIDQKICEFNRRADKLLEDIDRLEGNCFENEYQKLHKELELLQKRVSLCYETSKQIELMARDNEKALENANFLRSIASSSFHSNWVLQNRSIEGSRDKIKRVYQAYILKKIRESADHGRIDQALSKVQEILKEDPNNQKANNFLEKVIRAGSNGPSRASLHSAEKAKDIKDRYRCKYLGSFGHPELKRPFSLVTQENGEVIYASDPVSDKIHSFSRMGQYRGSVGGSFKRPLGLIQDSENCFWVCDSGNKRLVAIDAGGHKIKTYSLDTKFKNYLFVHPVFGTIEDGRFFLVANKKEGGRKGLLTFHKDIPNDLHEIVSADLGQRFTGLAFWGKWILFTEYFSPQMFMLRADDGQISALKEEWVKSSMKHLVAAGKWVFVCAQHYLLKLDMTTKNFVFFLPAKKIFKEKDEVIEGIIARPDTTGRYFLYLSTYSESKNIGYIHIYEV